MRKYLRKPKRRKDREVATNWTSLRRAALDRASLNNIPEEDPRLRLLSAAQDDFERVLRRLSILSPTDIDREFGGKPPE